MTSTATPERPVLLTAYEAARLLGIHRNSIPRLVEAGALTPVRLPGMHRPRYRRSELEALTQEGRAP